MERDPRLEGWDQAHSQVVSRLLEEYLKAPGNDAEEVQAAIASRALPIYRDMGGCVLLRPDGVLLEHAWEDVESRPLTHPTVRTAALLAAGRRFPALSGLRPSPVGSLCAACSGTGRVEGLVCSACGGTGRVS